MKIYNTYQERFTFQKAKIKAKINSSLGIVIVIPAFNEDDLISCINSINNCQLPDCGVEVIVVFNAAENTNDSIIRVNKKAKNELVQWYEKQVAPFFKLYCIEELDLPRKHAGVGLARKIGMDEAVFRLSKINRENGIVLCFDADSKCEENYLVEVNKHFKNNPNSSACSINFRHPIEGKEFSSSIYRGILYYELHLRYYRLGLEYAKLPYAYHTIGSSMAVRAIDYMKQGGMNKRKAGEDFYFLQKFIQLGNFTVLNSTSVIPSPRQSERVPFGTGRAMKEMLDGERKIEYSYSPQVFELLKLSIHDAISWYSNPMEKENLICTFYGYDHVFRKVNELKLNSNNQEGFIKRFFHWFNAFQCLKFVHYLRDNHVENCHLREAVPSLLKMLEIAPDSNQIKSLLTQLRKLDLEQV